MSVSKYLTEAELAERWRMVPATLRNWRYQRIKIGFTKIRGRVLYDIAEVDEIEANSIVRRASHD